VAFFFIKMIISHLDDKKGPWRLPAAATALKTKKPWTAAFGLSMA
jgi:hypothetical protein